MRCEGFCGKTFEKDSEDNTGAAKFRMTWHTKELGSQTASLCDECVDAVAKTLHPHYAYFLKPIKEQSIDWSVIQDGDKICIVAPGVTYLVRRSEILGGDILNDVFNIKLYNRGLPS